MTDTKSPVEHVDDPEAMLRLVDSMLDKIRESRGMVEQATVERVQRTHQKLQEVSAATESAASDMLDGLDRSLAWIGRLDEIAGAGDDEAARIRSQLRDEIFRLIGCLQFQDITAQQLRGASGVLEEIEGKLRAIAELFAHDRSGTGQQEKGDLLHEGHTFDPAASMLNAESRQSLADAIFNAGAEER